MTIKQTGFLKDVNGTYIPKDPNASLQYGMDWKEWLVQGDTVSSSTWTVETTGTNAVTVADSTILDNVALITIAGGQEGTVYTVANTIVTGDGYVDARRFRVKVEKRYAK
jgi:hypothetical protein